METALIIGLDLAVVGCAAAFGLLWYLASRSRLRRISSHEVVNSLDLNRIIVAYNRGQILNRRAALATSATGVLATLRLAIDLV